jgi:hypothetical protein
MCARADWMLLRVTDSKVRLLGWAIEQNEPKSQNGQETKNHQPRLREVAWVLLYW